MAASQARSTSVTRSISPLCWTSICCAVRSRWSAPARRTASVGHRHVFPAHASPRLARRDDCRMPRAHATRACTLPGPPARGRRAPAARHRAPARAWWRRCCSCRLGAVPLLGPRRAALRARGGRDAAARASWVTPDAAGRALAREAAPLLLAGRRRVPRARGDRDRRAPAVGRGRAAARRRDRPRAARASTARRAGLHAGFVARHLRCCAFAYGRAAAWTCCSPRCVTAAIGLLGLARCSASPAALALPAACVFVGLAHAGEGPARRCCCPRW